MIEKMAGALSKTRGDKQQPTAQIHLATDFHIESWAKSGFHIFKWF